MTDLRAAAQQALEALEEYQSKGAPFWACDAAVTALRAALAQQEPVAVHQFREANSAVWYDGHADHDDGNGPYEERVLYTHPPRREWASLTEEEINAALPHEPGDLDFVCARAIEQALRSKNQ